MLSCIKSLMQKGYLNIRELENLINFGFFTSKGGVSKGNFLSLNCSKKSNDIKNNVKKNIKIASERLNIKNKRLKFINQIHSNKIFLITNKNFSNELYGDGLITKDKKIALAILTADCAPVFIFDKQKNIICCLHSGWKGTLLNIVKESIKELNLNNVKTNNLIAVVGPCLAFNNFEVDKDFKIKFNNKNKLYFNFFKSKNKNKDFFDLRGLINFQLKSSGVKKIYNIKKDTYKNKSIFFSHRRATHLKSANTGRMINIISFKD